MNEKEILADLREDLLNARGSRDYAEAVACALDKAEGFLGREITPQEYREADRGKVYM